MFSANADGLGKKITSLKHELNETQSQIFTLQETQFRTKGRLKIKDFIIFEAIRKNKEKGGSMTGIHESLEPVLIEEYSDKFELLVVEIKVAGKEVRIINGYGPQESWTNEEKMPFFVALEEEVSKARLEGKSIILELDANSKLGNKYIKDDPHPISPNGIVLSGIIDRHALIVANGLTQKCIGLITRKRSTVLGTEESIIDFVCISSDMMDCLVSIQVDENRNHVLTGFTKTKFGPKRHESDHNSIVTKFNLRWKKIVKPVKVEVFNFNNKEGQKLFMK